AELLRPDRGAECADGRDGAASVTRPDHSEPGGAPRDLPEGRPGRLRGVAARGDPRGRAGEHLRRRRGPVRPPALTAEGREGTVEPPRAPRKSEEFSFSSLAPLAPWRFNSSSSPPSPATRPGSPRGGRPAPAAPPRAAAPAPPPARRA